jgi:hypothetical protein
VADLAGGQNRTAGGQSHPLPPPGYGPVSDQSVHLGPIAVVLTI